MKRFITKVTVTGADDSVDPAHLVAIAEKYPYVEFGILLSRNAMGKTRFPSREWLSALVAIGAGSKVQYAGHICGSWVNEILLGSWPEHELLEIHKTFMALFNRFQLNTHAVPHQVDHEKLHHILAMLDRRNQGVIFQYDDVNTELVAKAKEAGHQNIAALFDLSHGAGILPSTWPKPIEGVACGYAGGLSPGNVADQIRKIEPIIGMNPIWIDAETHLYSQACDHDDPRQPTGRPVFDLQKVERFLEEAQPWVI